MEAYTSSSSTAAAYMIGNKEEAIRGVKAVTTANSSYQSSLHSVRKSPLKTVKKPIAPLPPTRPKVYKVDPVNFRDLVQKLTGACAYENESESQQPQSQRLKSVAPPPINVSSSRSPFSFCGGEFAPQQLLPSPAKSPFSALYKDLMSEVSSSDAKPQKLSDCGIASNSLGLSLSPSSYNWFSYPLLSPASLSTL